MMHILAANLGKIKNCTHFCHLANNKSIPADMLHIFQRFFTCDLPAEAVRLMAKFLRLKETRELFHTQGAVNKKGSLVVSEKAFSERSWRMHDAAIKEWAIWLQMQPELGGLDEFELYTMLETLCVKRSRIAAGQIKGSYDVFVLCQNCEELVAVNVAPPAYGTETREEEKDANAKEAPKSSESSKRGKRRSKRTSGKKSSRGVAKPVAQPVAQEEEERVKEKGTNATAMAAGAAWERVYDFYWILQFRRFVAMCAICDVPIHSSQLHAKSCTCNCHAHVSCMQTWNDLRILHKLEERDCMICEKRAVRI
jgi:hypothetical protein